MFRTVHGPEHPSATGSPLTYGSRVQPADIARIALVTDPRVSPDGRTVAFVVTHVDVDDNVYRNAVWIAAADGSAPPRPFSAGEHGDGQPVWSPDGRWLAFTSRRGDDRKATLHVAPVDGPGEVRTLCARDEAIEEPAWSPDGSRIAFASRERTSRLDGPDERARPPRRIERLFTRLDGEGWTVDRPRSVFVVPVDGSAAPRVVAGGPFEHGGPAWAPDGATIAVTAARYEDWDVSPLLTDVHLVDPAGASEPRAVTRRTFAHQMPSWSPDGTRIAALAEDARVVHSHSQVVVIDVATGEERVLTAELDRQCLPMPGARSPVWDDDGLLFSCEDHGSVHVRRVPAAGGPSAPVVGGRRWVTGYDAAGGTLVFTATTATSLPDLFVLDPDGSERRLTAVGDVFHAAVPPREPERFTVPSTGGGEIDAWLVRPAEPAGERAPVLLSIHGGPMTQYGESWFDEFQMWTGAGYAVVYCNPHGSTGGTQAWARAIRAPEAEVEPGTGWGGIDADDVLTVLDAALAANPDLDPDRVGVLGGSYGGYLTSWLIGHTDRFVAACSERAVNNLESLEWASDVAGFFRFEIGVDHVRRPDVYRRMSPVTYVQDVRTPVLILHSENDLRCPINQADQLFVALRMLGRPVEYHRFDGESHGLSRNGSPRHRILRAEIILDWFARHLGGRAPARS
ncbi:peptidase S9 [Pseudonocardia sulfidoxydans NBRC 16205]|uniref:Peptidase S9 n=1 Tax=Pseudonocardia sulfidoxydans NBRC 16205 TaxID=1223511 RepID=A0A511DFI6_9PSEU|nr:peptidase S9 [Pseudonocardia sulfidoxydans NBRC 16205]